MKSKSFTTAGSLHPILFFVVVYAIALLFSIFICSSLFYSCNSKTERLSEGNVVPNEIVTLSVNQLAAK